MIIAQRAYDIFSRNNSFKAFANILKRNMGTVECGSSFPDWGYLCKSDAASEALHWEPFLYQYANYIAKKYKPGTKEYEENLAFLYGIVAHDYADMVWHWGPDNRGFLQAISHFSSSYQDDFSKSHDAETGAEFYLSFRDAKEMSFSNWKFPAKDISEVYKQINFSVSPIKLQACTLVFFLETKAVKHVGKTLFESKYQSASPFIEEEVDL